MAVEGGGGSSASELPGDSWADDARVFSASQGQAAAAASDAGGGRAALPRLDAAWQARADALSTRWGLAPGNLMALVEAAVTRQSADSLVEEENEVIEHVQGYFHILVHGS